MKNSTSILLGVLCIMSIEGCDIKEKARYNIVASEPGFICILDTQKGLVWEKRALKDDWKYWDLPKIRNVRMLYRRLENSDSNYPKTSFEEAISIIRAKKPHKDSIIWKDNDLVDIFLRNDLAISMTPDDDLNKLFLKIEQFIEDNQSLDTQNKLKVEGSPISR